MKNPLAAGAFRQFFARRRMFDALDARHASPLPHPPLDRRLIAINAMQLAGNVHTAKACLKILDR